MDSHSWDTWAVSIRGNQLWQVSAVLDRYLNDSESRISLPVEWEYRSYLNLPHEFFNNLSPVTDVARLQGGPYFQRLGEIAVAIPFLKKWYSPSPAAEERFLEHHWDLLRAADENHVTSVHVRRTDYLKNPYRFPTLPVSYYETAVGKVLEDHPDSIVYVFSDDPSWCREYLSHLARRVVFVEGHVRPIPPRLRKSDPTDIFDLWLMTHCDAHVVANSTFSWWGAFLSDQKNVLYPSRWFGPDAVGADRMWEAFPESWVKVDVDYP